MMYIYLRNWIVCYFLVLASCQTDSSTKQSLEVPKAVAAEQQVEMQVDSANFKYDSSGQMAWIPAGVYEMGGGSQQADADEFPRHQVKVDGFWMDIHEVTNGQFSTFVEATGYVTVAERPVIWEEIKQQLPPNTPKPADSVLQPGALVFKPTAGPVPMNNPGQWWDWVIGANWRHPEGPQSTIKDRMDHPVVQIAWDDAQAYAQWAGKRLPTESEWEWASRGGMDDPIYPWGNQPMDRAAQLANFWQGHFPYDNRKEDGYFATAPAKSYPPNGYGLYDMAGNVWEWCSDWYHVDAYADLQRTGVADNPAGPENSFDPQEPYTPKKVVRGGSFLCNDSYCSGYRVSRRMKSSRDSGLNHTGFRCVRN